MSTIEELSQQTQLAEAAYANFIDSTGNLITTDAGITGALIASGFSTNASGQSSQAVDFIAHWEVVDQFTASGLFGLTDSSGFSATLFRNKDTRQYSIALRGTQLVPSDLSADIGDILLDGISLDQVTDMYNYWQSLNHVGNYQAVQLNTLTPETVALRTAYSLNAAAGLAYESTLRARQDVIIDYPSLTVRTVQFVDSSQLADPRLQNGSGILSGTTFVNLDGHSLGGHLAMAFSRLFPNATNSVVAVNGAGFNFGNTNVDHLFAMLSGAPGFDAGKITNLVGSAAMNLVSQDWLFLQQPAGRNEIYTESASPSTTFGHGSSQMTDSLALYNLFAIIDPSLDSTDGLATLTGIFENTSNRGRDSLELALDALRKIFGKQSLTPGYAGVTDSTTIKRGQVLNLE